MHLTLLLAALAAGPFASLEDAVYAGAFREAARMGAEGATAEQKRGLEHLAEARKFLLEEQPSAARSALRKAAALYPALGQGAEFWSCKMFRREQRDKQADECFAKAGIDEKAGDARMKKLRDGLAAGKDGSSVELAARECSGLSCGNAGVPTSPERQKYDEPDTKIPTGPSGASGGSTTSDKK